MDQLSGRICYNPSMLVACSHCGAPLDVQGGTISFVKCRYCGRTNQLQSLRTVAPQTPPGWRPPPVWTPPPYMPAGPSPLKYRGGAAPALIVPLALVLVLALAGVVAGVIAAATRRPGGSIPGVSGGPSGLPVAQLAAVTLRETPERLAAITHASAGSDLRMRVPLSGSRFDAITFEWDPAHRDHVKSFYLNLSGSSPQDAAIRQRLSALLGRRFNGEHFQWEGCGLYFAPSGGVLSVNIQLDRAVFGENTGWRDQAEALWAVTRSAALGLPGAVDPRILRDWLGRGYPLGQLSAFDSDTGVDAADAAVRRLFPGAVRELHIDLSYAVALDHPLFSHAELQWANKKASKMKEIELRPPPGLQKFADQEILVSCVTAAFGKADRESEGDHLRGGGKDFTWRPKGGGEVRIYEHMIAVRVRDNPFAGAMPRDRLAKVIQTLDACGR